MKSYHTKKQYNLQSEQIGRIIINENDLTQYYHNGIYSELSFFSTYDL